MSKQTATDYLIQEIKNDSLVQAKSTQEWNEVFRKAMQMEREQIVEACNSQKNDYRGMPTYNKSGEQYYNETYGGQDE
jgi:predicted transcriptional regulator